jgi:hypothetical protein
MNSAAKADATTIVSVARIVRGQVREGVGCLSCIGDHNYRFSRENSTHRRSGFAANHWGVPSAGKPILMDEPHGRQQLLWIIRCRASAVSAGPLLMLLVPWAAAGISLRQTGG